MNKDYEYCRGFGLIGQPELCKKCRRNILHSKSMPNEVERWAIIQYDKNTGECPMFDKKPNFFDKILSYFKTTQKDEK